MTNKRLIKALTVMLATASLATSVYAADECEPDTLLSNGQGTIEINYNCDEVALSGATISIYKIADVTLTDKTICYSLTDDLNSYSVLNNFGRETIFDEMTAAESNRIAKELSEIKLKTTYTAITDKDGNCSFDAVPYGMYLVKQTGSEGVSADYTTFDPFLLSVPIVDDESGDYIFNVHTLPKSEVYSIPETTTPTETTPHETTPEETTTPPSPILGIEDNSEILARIFAGTAIGCGLMVAALTLGSFIERKKKDK